VIRGVLTDLCSIGHLPVPAFPLPSFACWALDEDDGCWADFTTLEVVGDIALSRASSIPLSSSSSPSFGPELC